MHVAFGDFESWEKKIRPDLDARFDVSFVNLGRTPLEDFDAIIPLQLRHYRVLARYPELRGVKFFHPSRAAVSLCDDKLKLAEFLAGEGFAQYVPVRRSPRLPYPYIWKKRRGWWGMHAHIVNGPDDERNLKLNDKNWFAQTLVPGSVEFATHFLRVDGEIRYVSTVTHQMAAPAFVNGVQDAPLHSSFQRGCEFLEIFSAMLDRLEFEGTACIDYKVVDGKPVVFEINPRFGGSLCGDINAYLDAYLGALKPQTRRPSLLTTLMRTSRRVLARLFP